MKGKTNSYFNYFFFSSRRRHTRLVSDWSSDVCSSDLKSLALLRGSTPLQPPPHARQKLGAASGLSPSAAPTSCTADRKSVV